MMSSADSRPASNLSASSARLATQKALSSSASAPSVRHISRISPYEPGPRSRRGGDWDEGPICRLTGPRRRARRRIRARSRRSSRRHGRPAYSSAVIWNGPVTVPKPGIATCQARISPAKKHRTRQRVARPPDPWNSPPPDSDARCTPAPPSSSLQRPAGFGIGDVDGLRVESQPPGAQARDGHICPAIVDLDEQVLAFLAVMDMSLSCSGSWWVGYIALTARVTARKPQSRHMQPGFRRANGSTFARA